MLNRSRVAIISTVVIAAAITAIVSYTLINYLSPPPAALPAIPSDEAASELEPGGGPRVYDSITPIKESGR